MRDNKYNTIKKYRGVTPSLRHRVVTEKPQKKLKIKKLTRIVKKTGGRDNKGIIRMRYRGGGHKRQLRELDLRRVNGKYSTSRYLTVEYDPNRTGFITRYMTRKMKHYYVLNSTEITKEIKGYGSKNYKDYNMGETYKLKDIPIGTRIHNIELRKGEVGKLTRSAGSYSMILNKTEDKAIIRLTSKKIKELDLENKATIGQVGHTNHKLEVKGKAGATRWVGKRPKVRGYAMNPIDHPHGGKTRGGGQPRTKWGKQAKWVKTKKESKTKG